jgi:hypothetical protein
MIVITVLGAWLGFAIVWALAEIHAWKLRRRELREARKELKR